MFGRVLEKLFLIDLQKVSGGIERKIVACGVVKLLTECPEMYTGSYQKYWSPLLQVRMWNRVLWTIKLTFDLQALINFFEGQVDNSTIPDDDFVDVDDTPAYQTTSAKLNFANSSKSDPLQGK